jgi:hypothetical protein
LAEDEYAPRLVTKFNVDPVEHRMVDMDEIWSLRLEVA